MMSNLFECPAYTMSLLGPRPVVALVKEHNEYIVFWNGIIMPYAAAMYLALEGGNIYPTPQVKSCLGNAFRRLRFSGALARGNTFQTDPNKRKSVSTRFAMDGYKGLMRAHMAKMRQQFSTAQLFAMLDMEKAHEISVCSER